MTKSETFMIPNHKAAKLSELDMMIVNSVPPGGNWKNIPLDVPSKRIEQIRDSYAQGKGSRSTYYGRLLPDMPAYTMEGANKQVISSQADSLIKISRIWADFFPANTSNQPI